ncbi:MAG: TPM domain-containing protein [bacterium]|nr:TPM domain-containing protein [bacterium]
MRIILVLLLMLGSTQSLTFASFPKLTGYVTDTVGVLSPQEVALLNSVSAQLDRAAQVQLTSVVVDSLDGLSVEEYAVRLFEIAGIGHKNSDRGLLVLVAVGDRKVRIEVGYGLEGIIPDGKAGAILDDYVVPEFKKNEFGAGVRSGHLVIAKQLSEYFNVALQLDGRVPMPVYSNSQGSGWKETIFVFIFLIVLITILSRLGRHGRHMKWLPLLFLLGGLSGSRGRYRGGFFGGGSGFGGFGGGGAGGGGSSRGF